MASEYLTQLKYDNIISSGEGLITEAEGALYDRADLIGWIEPRHATVDGMQHILELLNFTLKAGEASKKLEPLSSSDAPLLADTTDGQKGIKRALTTGVYGATLVANANLVIPAPPYTICVVARQPLANSGVMLATMPSSPGVASPLVIDFNSSNQVAFYSNFGTGTRIRTGTTANDGNPHLWAFTHDGTTAAIYRNGSLLLSGALAPNVAGVLRLMSQLDNSGLSFNGFDDYIELVAISNAVDPEFHEVVKDIVRERHSGWTIL